MRIKITKKRKCLKCGKVGFGSVHNHHIIYKPAKTVFLCEKCHGNISSIDSYSRRIYLKIFKKRIVLRSKDDNILRNLLYSHFIETDKDLSTRRLRKDYAKKVLQRVS